VLEVLVGDEGRAVMDHVQGEELLDRQGPAEIEPLEGVAPKQLIEIGLFSCFDTLDDQGYLQQGRHVYYASYDVLCPF
jgi:hypothetical protein